ncbi:MAG TPA: ParB/RepB/Spo0J family partition protein [Planctomycetota bacterium]|jgi:ParB family chromosome partitioning protein
MEPQKPKRGLSALLASTTQPQSQGQVIANAPVPVAPQSSVITADVPPSAIRPNPSQPRTHFEPEALAELAASIKVHGLVQPVVVRQLQPSEVVGEFKYELIAGERRWRASQMAGLSVVPAIIKQVFAPRDILLLSLVENIQRNDLNPIEEALAYRRLGTEFNLTHDQIADGVGKNRVTVTNLIRVLDLPSSIQEAIKNGKLSTGHAKVLLAIPDPRIQTQIAAKAQAENLSVRELERLVSWQRPTPSGSGEGASAARTKPLGRSRVPQPQLLECEHRLREHFGTRVTVEETAQKGRVIVEFYSPEDFERIVKIMGLI